MKEQDRVEEIIRRRDRLKGDRATLDSHIEDVATFVAPRLGGITSTRTKGGSRMERVFDCTAIDANDIFAAGMYGNLCQGRWFLLKSKDAETDQEDAISIWFMEITRILHEELAVSNFGQIIFRPSI